MAVAVAAAVPQPRVLPLLPDDEGEEDAAAVAPTAAAPAAPDEPSRPTTRVAAEQCLRRRGEGGKIKTT